MVDGREVEVDDGVEDEVDELSRMLVVAVATDALESLPGGGAIGFGDGNEGDEGLTVFLAGEDINGAESGIGLARVGRVSLEVDKLEGRRCSGSRFQP